MLPLNWLTQQYLVMIATALFFAISVQFVPRRRVPLLAPAFAFPIWFFEWSTPKDDGAGLAVWLSLAMLLVLTGLAMGFSGVLRLVGVRRGTSVAVMCLAATAVAAFAVWYR